MITENLSTLKIHKLSQEQYNKAVENGNVEANALYLTPVDDDIEKHNSSTDAHNDIRSRIHNLENTPSSTSIDYDEERQVLTIEQKTPLENGDPDYTDKSLSIDGAAADAKAVGDAIGELNEKLVQETENLSKDIDNKADKIIATAQGKSIVISDSSDDSIQNLKLYGKTTQNTTTGEQLFDVWKMPIYTNGSHTQRGITGSILEDGALLFQGTPTETGIIFTTFHDDIIDMLVNGQEYIGNMSTQITYLDGSVEYIKSFTSFALNKDTMVSIQPYIQRNTDNYVDGEIFYPMFNKGDTVLPYEPYTGGIASPNFNYKQPLESKGDNGNVEVSVYGENLIPYPYVKKTYYVSGVTFEESKGLIMVNGTAENNKCDFYLYGAEYDNGEYIYFPKGEYKTSLLPINDSFNNANEFIALRTLEKGTILNANAIVKALKETGLHIYGIFIRAGFVGKTYNNAILQPVITLLKTLNFVDRFEGDNKTIALNTPNGLNGIPLGTTIPNVIANSPIHMAGVYWDEEEQQYYISDTVDNESGVLVQRTIHESWGKNGIVKSSDGKYFAVGGVKAKLSNLGICNIASYTQGSFNFGQFWRADSRYIIGNLDDNGNEIYSTVDDFYEVVGGEVEFLGIIDTPIEIPLTPEEIESYKALHSNYPYTTVMNNCDAHMELSYNADTKCYIDNLEKKHNEEISQLRTAIIALGGTL